jgi:hypothetical protein
MGCNVDCDIRSREADRPNRSLDADRPKPRSFDAERTNPRSRDAERDMRPEAGVRSAELAVATCDNGRKGVKRGRI